MSCRIEAFKRVADGRGVEGSQCLDIGQRGAQGIPGLRLAHAGDRLALRIGQDHVAGESPLVDEGLPVQIAATGRIIDRR